MLAEEHETPTICRLQEIRADQETMRGEIGQLREEVKDLTQRVDGNTLILNLVAGVVHDHEQRITSLERAD